MRVSSAVLAILAIAPGAAARADAPPRSGAVSLSLSGASIPVDYTVYPADFDPSKPTVVNIAGGPVPFDIKWDKPPTLLAGVQVITISYLGATRSGKGIPKFSPLDTLKNFTSDNEAKAIAGVIRKEGLQRYVLWGQSHGVQQCLRAIDTIQNDPTLAVKPVAAVLDSGLGRQVDPADDAAKQALGADGAHGKCGKPGMPPPSDEQPIIDGRSVAAYARLCGLKFTRPQDQLTLTRNLQMFSQGMLKVLGDLPGGPALQAQFGCPPADKIDFALWRTAMTCGSFTKEFLVSQCRQHAPPNAQGSCQNQPPCGESPLDITKYNLGKTAILGIQSMDDCTNWTRSMDFLMSHLGMGKGAYLRLTGAGGHVTYPNTDAWKGCRDPELQGKITGALFGGDASLARKLMLSCYSGSPEGGAAAEPPATGGADGTAAIPAE